MNDTFGSRISARVKSGTAYVAVLAVYAAFCIGSAIYFGIIGQVRNCLLSAGMTLIAPLFLILESALRIKIPAVFAGVVLFVAAGSVLGSCYNLYTILPWFDTLLHITSGFIFSCLGFAVLELFHGRPQSKKSLWACILFGVAFSLALAVLWELFEYAASVIGGFDMEEDAYITGFRSYLISGNHNETFDVENITQTVIYYGDGQVLTIDGYIDIGLIDTIVDMAVCFIGALVFLLVMGIDGAFGGKVSRCLVPQVGERKPQCREGDELSQIS